jgi:hypothetical protein
MAIYTQAELEQLTPEEYSEFLVDGILVDDDCPMWWEMDLQEIE